MMNDKITKKTKKKLSKNTVLWRYMPFEAFAALLMKHVLWFNRIDKFPDKTEGWYPPKYYDISFLTGEYEKTFPGYEWVCNFGPKWQAEQAVIRHKMTTRYRIRWAVNSWRKGKKDSEAMWATYSRLDSGIAVVTTVGRLRKAFIDPNWRVQIDEIQYVDRDSFPFGGYPQPFLCKDDSFKYEEEVRAFVDLLQDKDDPPILEFSVDLNTPSDEIKAPAGSALAELDGVCGTDVQVSPESLINRVVLAPKTPLWVVSIIQKILDNAKVECQCEISTLYDYPAEV